VSAFLAEDPTGAFVERVRRRIARDGGDPTPRALDAALREEPALVADDGGFGSLRRAVSDELLGIGPLAALRRDESVTDILVNGADQVWFDRGRGLERSGVRFGSDAEVRALAQRLASAAGRRLDDAAPFADAPLPGGIRLHAMLPPLVAAPTLCLRLFRPAGFDLAGLREEGMFDDGAARLLRRIVAARLAFVISGGAGAGKSTLLGAMLAAADPAERILVVEDVPELAIDHPHVVRLMTRPANIEGAGEVGPAALVRQALRMRPDRVVVGEFRGGEAMDLLAALNTGHEGGAATVHANSAAAVPARFEALGALAGAPGPAVLAQLVAAVDVVIHLRRDRGGRRRVEQLAMLARRGAEVAVRPFWSRGAVAAAPGAGPSDAAVAAGAAPVDRRGLPGGSGSADAPSGLLGPDARAAESAARREFESMLREREGDGW
jgi:pilus assembly protein CpaF